MAITHAESTARIKSICNHTLQAAKLNLGLGREQVRTTVHFNSDGTMYVDSDNAQVAEKVTISLSNSKLLKAVASNLSIAYKWDGK